MGLFFYFRCPVLSTPQEKVTNVARFAMEFQLQRFCTDSIIPYLSQGKPNSSGCLHVLYVESEYQMISIPFSVTMISAVPPVWRRIHQPVSQSTFHPAAHDLHLPLVVTLVVGGIYKYGNRHNIEQMSDYESQKANDIAF